ncbi:MAG: hypothetical protein ACLTNE_15725 [Intestinimonas butyriciproducens]|uniref:hypothetical protein n=1 Tax=Intestinimonas butyriciproducens TaxID=1297617 RepID=UPI0039942B3E
MSALPSRRGQPLPSCPPAPARPPHQSYGKVLDVDSGAVKLGGIDVKDYVLDSLMHNFSMVFHAYLFNDSIENNIGSASRTPPMRRWWRARRPGARPSRPCRRLRYHHRESGATISGGTSASIARAAADALIIILDEATANVDPENEAELQEAIEALTEKTILRLLTV